MLGALLSLALAQSPTMAGAPVSAVTGKVIDYTTSLYLTGPAVGVQCTNGAITTDQAGTVTVTRASTSYCQNGSGSYTLIDTNKAVVESEGIRIEPASTNRVAYSQALNGNWTPTNVTLTDTVIDPVNGGATAEQWDTSAAGGNLESPAFTITGTSAVMSFWYKHGGGDNGTVVLYDQSAGAARITTTLTTGTVAFANMSARSSGSSSAIVSGNTHSVQFYPGGAAGEASGVILWGVQVEPARTTMTSYIPTAGAAVTRAADVPTIVIPDNAAAGCYGATVYATAPAFPQRVGSKVSGDLLAYNNTVSFFANDGTNTINSPNVTNMTARSVPVRVQWGGSAARVDLDGSTGTPGSFDGAFGSGTTLYLGTNNGNQGLLGWLKKIKVSTSTNGCVP